MRIIQQDVDYILISYNLGVNSAKVEGQTSESEKKVPRYHYVCDVCGEDWNLPIPDWKIKLVSLAMFNDLFKNMTCPVCYTNRIHYKPEDLPKPNHQLGYNGRRRHDDE